MWDSVEHRLALLEFAVTGRLRCRKSQQQVWNHLVELPWTRRTGRRDEIAIVENRRQEVERLLTQIWPQWKQVQVELAGAGLPTNEQGWSRLQDIERARLATGLPSRLNRRTAIAQVGPHSKASLSVPRREALAEMNLMHDGTLRLRPSAGLRIRRNDHELDATEVAGILGEVVLTERAMTDGTALTGKPPDALLLVENLGAYLDIPAPSGWLLAHVPGWDTPAVRLLLKDLQNVPVIHFGDLDPNGVRIMWHLRQFRPYLRWFVPEFWREYLPKAALRADWPADLDLAGLPSLVREIAADGFWLEQEVIVLDARLQPALLSCIRL